MEKCYLNGCGIWATEDSLSNMACDNSRNWNLLADVAKLRLRRMCSWSTGSIELKVTSWLRKIRSLLSYCLTVKQWYSSISIREFFFSKKCSLTLYCFRRKRYVIFIKLQKFFSLEVRYFSFYISALCKLRENF